MTLPGVILPGRNMPKRECSRIDISEVGRGFLTCGAIVKAAL
jgi:hypothetical protein